MTLGAMAGHHHQNADATAASIGDNSMPAWAKDHAWSIISAAIDRPDDHKHTDCVYYAAAAAAPLRGTGWKFTAGGAFPLGCGLSGWGFAGRRDRPLRTASNQVDPEDGSFNGHCWVQLGDGRWSPSLILDVTAGYYGDAVDLKIGVVYDRLPKLQKSVRAYHAERITSVRKAALRDRNWVSLIRQITGDSKPPRQ